MAKFWQAIWPSSINQNQTGYQPINGGPAVFFSSEAAAQVRSRDTYTWRNLYARVLTNGITVTTTLRTRVNGANGGQSVSITSGATGEFEDASNTDSVVTGDLLSYQSVAGVGGSTMTLGAIASLLEHSSGVSVAVNSNAGSTPLNAATYYLPIGGGGIEGTEANAQVTCRRATTLSRLRAYISTNAASGTSSLKCRVNGADGNQSVSITAATTGDFEDTSNSDSVADGDEVCTSITAGGTGNMYWTVVQYETSVATILMTLGSGGLSSTHYKSISGGKSSATESDVQVPARATGLVFAQLYVNVGTNTRSVSTSYGLRKNSSTVISVSVPASTTGIFEETSTTVTSDATTDDFNFILSAGGGGTGTISLEQLSITQYATEVVTISGATAAASAAALAGQFLGNRIISGEPASSTAAAGIGSVSAVRIVTVAGEKATASAAAGAGTVATFPAAIIFGVAAEAAALALEATVVGMRILAVSGATATAAAASNAGAALIGRAVEGVTATATAIANAGAVVATRDNIPSFLVRGSSRVIRRLARGVSHGHRPGGG